MRRGASGRSWRWLGVVLTAQPGHEPGPARLSEGVLACEPPVPLHRQRTWVRIISSLYGFALASILSAPELSRYDAAAHAFFFLAAATRFDRKPW